MANMFLGFFRKKHLKTCISMFFGKYLFHIFAALIVIKSTSYLSMHEKDVKNN